MKTTHCLVAGVLLTVCVSASSGQLRVRKSVTSLSPAELQTLRQGIAEMKRRSANDVSDPTGWQFQADIHGTFSDRVHPLFNQCEHGTIHFLTWHRAYLHFFERILRDAAGDSTLTLPYWDWSVDRALPVAFRVPSNATNPLFHPERQMNSGALLPTSVVINDLNQALGRVRFSRNRMQRGFSDLLEGSPHGAVHVLVGGDMSMVPAAANDPIFWFHHCNIDRQWDKWLRMGSGRRNPMDPDFLGRRFTFVDERGQQVSFRVHDTLNSQALGYRYDDIPGQETLVATVAMTEAIPQVLAASSSLETPGANRLEFASKRIPLEFSPGGASRLESVSNDGGRLTLVVKNIESDTPPTFNYGVYVNLPVDAEADDQRAEFHRVGTINFFGNTKADHVAGHEPAEPGFSEDFDITEILGKLRGAGVIKSGEKLEITLKPITLVPPQDGLEAMNTIARESATKANVQFGSIEIVRVPE